MTTITVELTDSGILVCDAETQDAATSFDSLPPLTAARYLVVASEAGNDLRQHAAPLLEHIRPHADSTLVALEAGLGSAHAGEDEPPAMSLAAALGVTIVAPEGKFLSCDGALYAFGGDSGWVAYSPLGAKVMHGRRYPAPAWQSHLPPKVEGTVQIPAGLWITATPDPSHAVHLSEIAVRPQQLLIVVGSPGETAPEYTRLLAALRGLPDHTRASAVLIGYGHTSLELNTIRRLAAELQETVRIAHGVTIAGDFVRLDLARETTTGTFARESTCAPDGVFELDHWSAPLGLTTVSRNTYQLTDDWIVDVVPAGLVLRPVSEPPSDSGESIPVIAETLTVMLRGEGARDLRRVVGPLRTMLERLRGYASTRLIPGDRAARRVIRDAFPGMWAPTAGLSVTVDGRIIAATVDEDEFPLQDDQHSDAPADEDGVDHEPASNDALAHSVIAAPTEDPAIAVMPHDTIVDVDEAAQAPHVAETSAEHAHNHHSSFVEEIISRKQTPQPVSMTESAGPIASTASQGASSAAAALPQLTAPLAAQASDPADALSRALRGAAATADLLPRRSPPSTASDTDAISRGTVATHDTAFPQDAAVPQHPENSHADEPTLHAADEIASAATAAVEETAPAVDVEVPRLARSTVQQRHRVRSAFGARYDVASRSISQLLAQQPGMRVSSGDRSTLLTTLSVVSVFADDPSAQYDLDFHTCLAEGLSALPTTRSIVVRGLPPESTATMNSVLSTPKPFISAPVDGPLTGQMEALIWTTSGRRLDRLMADTTAATDIIVPAHTRFRVLGTADGPVPRLLLTEDGANDDSVLERLHDAAASRDDNPTTLQDSRWRGELPIAV